MTPETEVVLEAVLFGGFIGFWIGVLAGYSRGHIDGWKERRKEGEGK